MIDYILLLGLVQAASSCTCPCAGLTNRLLGSDGRWYATADNVRPDVTYTWINYAIGSGGDADGTCGEEKARLSKSSKTTGKTCHGDKCGPLSTPNWVVAPRFTNDLDEADETIKVSPAVKSMISENVWSTQNLVLGDGSAWRTGWGTEAGSIKGPQGWLGSTSNGYYAKFCNSRVLVVCEDTDACCSESNDTPTDSPTAKPNAVQCEQPDSASVCFPEAKVLCASNVGYREQICPYMCGTCNVPYAESAGIQCEIPDSTTMCFSSAAVLCKDNVNYRDEICPFMCGTCTKAYSSNNSLPTPAPTPPSVSPPSPTPAPDAAWELPQGCPEWCVEDVTKGQKTASEVCDMAKCKTCTFPDSEVTCSSDAATPPSPTP
eukprot:gene17096-32843_t